MNISQLKLRSEKFDDDDDRKKRKRKHQRRINFRSQNITENFSKI